LLNTIRLLAAVVIYVLESLVFYFSEIHLQELLIIICQVDMYGLSRELLIIVDRLGSFLKETMIFWVGVFLVLAGLLNYLRAVASAFFRAHVGEATK
jgi:hypothetical protein